VVAVFCFCFSFLCRNSASLCGILWGRKGGIKGGAGRCKKFMHGKRNSVRDARQWRIGPTRGRTRSGPAYELCWNVRKTSQRGV